MKENQYFVSKTLALNQYFVHVSRHLSLVYWLQVISPSLGTWRHFEVGVWERHWSITIIQWPGNPRLLSSWFSERHYFPLFMVNCLSECDELLFGAKAQNSLVIVENRNGFFYHHFLRTLTRECSNHWARSQLEISKTFINFKKLFCIWSNTTRNCSFPN